MLTQEDGPLNIFRRIRQFFGVTHEGDGTIWEIPERSFAKLFTCLWCMSIWVGVAMYGIWLLVPALVWILAISTGAVIIDRFVGDKSA